MMRLSSCTIYYKLAIQKKLILNNLNLIMVLINQYTFTKRIFDTNLYFEHFDLLETKKVAFASSLLTYTIFLWWQERSQKPHPLGINYSEWYGKWLEPANADYIAQTALRSLSRPANQWPMFFRFLDSLVKLHRQLQKMIFIVLLKAYILSCIVMQEVQFCFLPSCNGILWAHISHRFSKIQPRPFSQHNDRSQKGWQL